MDKYEQINRRSIEVEEYVNEAKYRRLTDGYGRIIVGVIVTLSILLLFVSAISADHTYKVW